MRGPIDRPLPERPPQPQPRSGPGEDRREGVMAAMVVAAIVIGALYFARIILEPLALALLLSLLLAPAVRRLQRWSIGRPAAVAVSVLLASLLILGFAAAVGEQLIGLAQNLPRYEDNVAAKIRSVNSLPGGLIGRVTHAVRDLNKEFAAADRVPAEKPPAKGAPPPEPKPIAVELGQPGPAPLDVLRAVLAPLLEPLATGGLVVIFVVMILLKREDLRDRVLRLAGAQDLNRTTVAMNEAAERVSRYLLMQLAVGLCYGVPVGTGLALIGIPNAPLWGILGVALRFIPYLGGPITAAFPVALAVAVDPGWSLVLWTVLLFAGIELVFANFAEPWVYGRSTGLSSVAVIAAAAFWTWLWGVVGLLLATPLTVCLVVLGRHVPQLRFLDVLLGNRPVLTSEESFYQRLLAQDPEEATEQAEEFARDSSIEAFFDDVAIPALALAQADCDRGALAADRRAVIAAGLAAVLDNLAAEGLVEGDAGEPAETAAELVVCLAGRNELDLAAAWLLHHLLRRRGHRALVFSPDAIATLNPARPPLKAAAVVCLALVSTDSTARARYLVRRIRRQARRARLVVGFWGQTADGFSAADAVVATAADGVVTSLEDAVAAIEAVVSPSASDASAAAAGDRLARRSA